MDKWGHVIVEYGNPSISDHSSMMVLRQKTQQHGKVSFKFFNVWTEHESFYGNGGGYMEKKTMEIA